MKHMSVTYKYADCRDILPTLEDNSIELCLTDLPWFTPKTGRYENSNEWDFYGPIHEEIMRVCKGAMYECSHRLAWEFIRNTEPKDCIYWYIPFMTKVRGHLDYFLCYGDIKHRNHLKHVMNFNYVHEKWCIHPTPKTLELYSYILGKIKPESVIDPFAGSGAVIESALKLGIEAYSIELDEKYKPDLMYRLERVKRYKPQKTMESFMGK